MWMLDSEKIRKKPETFEFRKPNICGYNEAFKSSSSQSRKDHQREAFL